MGPRSTAPFIDLVISECQKKYGAKHDIDFPPMFIYSLPTPFYINKPVDREQMKKVVLEGLKKLESTGVDFIAMPCNTVYVYFDELQSSLKVPLLNIVNETIASLSTDAGKIGLLATRATVESRVYQKYFSDRIIWMDTWQILADEMITKVKAGVANSQFEQSWNSLIKLIQRAGCSSMILACTDLSALGYMTSGIEVVDSTKCLASAVVREYLV